MKTIHQKLQEFYKRDNLPSPYNSKLEQLQEVHLDTVSRSYELAQEADKKIKALMECKSCSCGDKGYFVSENLYNHEPELIQCEFCYTNPNSRFNVIKKIKAGKL